MIDELPPELRDLLDAERAAVPDAAVRTAVRSRLTLAAHGGLGLAGALKILSVLALVAGTAAISAVVTRSSSPSTPAVTGPDPIVTRAPVPSVVPAPAPRVELAAPPPAPAPRARVAVQPRPHVTTAAHEPAPPARQPSIEPHRPSAVLPAGHRSQPSEAALLGLAWHAIGDADPAHALALVDESAQRFPDGALAEEREVIRIQALADLARVTEARVLAARFLAAYPHSVHRSLVQEATR